MAVKIFIPLSSIAAGTGIAVVTSSTVFRIINTSSSSENPLIPAAFGTAHQSPLARHVPALPNRSSGVFTGLAVTSGPGLSLNIAAGKAMVNSSLKSKSASPISGVNDTYNFVILTGAGTITRVTGVNSLPAFYALLGVARITGNKVRSIRDMRLRIGDIWMLAPGEATAFQLKTGSDGIFAYDVGGSLIGKPTASQTIIRYPLPRAIRFATSLALSQGKSATAANSSTVFSLRKNGTHFARMTWGSGTTIASFGGTSQSFAAGDVLTVVAPASPDADFASFGFSLAGIKVL
jgi:hypothetical protein